MQALTIDISEQDASDTDKICAASEKLLSIFEEYWADDDGQQSENYSGEEDSDSSSDSPSERKVRSVPLRRGSVRQRRGGFRRESRDSSRRAAMPSEDNEGDCSFDAQHAGKVLSRLMRNKHAKPFLEPVDPVALELEDYFEVTVLTIFYI